MPFAKANGINMYYELHGKGENLLVLIQGFTNNYLIWKECLPFLTDHYQVLLFDNRGCGQSDHPLPPYNMKMMAQDTIELLNTLSLKPAYFAGHSMGGMILQQICVDHPEYVKKAIICASCAKVPFTSLVQIDTISKLFQTGIDPALILETVIPWMFSSECLSKKGNLEKIVDALVNNPFPQKPLGYVGQGEALKHFDLTDKLSSIYAPCLVIAGEEDFFTPLSCSKQMADKIPNAKLKIFPGQGHVMLIEKPKELSEDIKAFCR